MWLVRLSIFKPVFISMITLFLMVLGIMGYMRLNVDQYPKIEPPVITVTTEYAGAGPAEIETLISKPLEERINQIGGIERLISTSRDSFSQIVVEFKLEKSAKEAAIDVRDKVNAARKLLPDDTKDPVIERLDFSDKPILRLALSKTDFDHKKASPKELTQNESMLRYQADQVLKQKIQTVDGVGRVDVFGGLSREIEVLLDLQKLLAFNLSPRDVQDAIKKSNANIPSGEMREEPTERSIRLIGEFLNVKDIQQIVIKNLPGGRVVRVQDLGQVIDGFKDRDSMARLGDKPVVFLEVRKQSDANTVDVAENVIKRVTQINSASTDGLKMEPVYDGAKTIRLTLHDVIETLFIAAILSIIVVYFFLGSVQSTLITGLALPTTIIGTFFALYVFGYTLNIMTLLGLTLAVGLILDDAIVVRENIWNKIEQGLPPIQASLEGTRQVYTAVLATSLTILAVFIPVTFIPGVVGKFFAAFAITVCFGVIFSTFDAVTMAPMLSAHLISTQKNPGRHEKKLNPLLRITEGWGKVVSKFYGRLLHRALSAPLLVLILAGGIFATTVYLGKYVGFTFLPQDESGEMEVSLEGPAGVSIEEMNRLVHFAESKIAEQAEVAYYSTRIGNDFGDKNIGLIFVKLVPKPERDVTTSQMIDRLRSLTKSFGLAEKLSITIKPPGGGGPGRPISMVVQGPDNSQLLKISDQILEKGPAQVLTVVNLESNLKPGRGEIQYILDRKRLGEFGLTGNAVGETLRGMYAGDLSGTYREMGTEYDIRVRLRPEDRQDIQAVQNLTIPNSRGEPVPLRAVTNLIYATSPTKIIRIDQSRAALIEADLPTGVPLAKALADLKQFASSLLPTGYHLDFQGQAKSLNDLAIGGVVALGLGALFIYMIMASLYESLLIPFSILLTLPLAIVGAILALLISQKSMDVYGVIGMILLMGLVTKNAILLVDYVEHLRKETGMSRDQALFEGSMRRLRPIMMTTVAMIAGMVPVAVGIGEINKIRSAMGIASIGGMISSTFLSLIVVPCFYIYMDKIRERFRRKKTEGTESGVLVTQEGK